MLGARRKTPLPSGFVRDLRAAWEASDPALVGRAILATIRDDLHAAYEAELGGESERRAVVELEASWAVFERAIGRTSGRYSQLCAELEESILGDPLHLPVDLLGALGRGRAEVLHTQAIASLCHLAGEDDPWRLLRALLDVACPDGARRFDKAEITAEQGIDDGGIPDLVIWLTDGETKRLVVLENKVGTTDHTGQLDAYATWALRASVDKAPVLIYLTPAGSRPATARDSDAWIVLSYWKLAAVWRRELRSLCGPWADLLRLYLASVLRHVLGMRIGASGVASDLDVASQIAIIPYLEAATGKEPA